MITKKEAGLNADYKDLSVLCLNYGIDYKYISNINDEEVIRYVREKNADIIYCFGWSQIIKKELLEITPMGVIGFHPAALPNNRGRHPIIWALALGLNETASTFFKMDEGADTGDIVSQVKIPICESDYAADLYENIMCWTGILRHCAGPGTQSDSQHQSCCYRAAQTGSRRGRTECGYRIGKIRRRILYCRVYGNR